MNALHVTIYANVVAIMLILGILVLARQLNIRDPLEKKIFLSLLVINLCMSVGYIIGVLRDLRVIHCTPFSALIIETVLEIIINLFIFQWLIYVDYRIYHSVGHIRRNAIVILIPVAVIVCLDIVNLFTGVMLRFDENLVLTEMPLYLLTDLVRTGYGIWSLILLAYCKKHDDRMKFFSVLPFLVPMVFYGGLYYFTDFATTSLGMAFGLTLIYVQMINEQCYQDGETGFFNRLYLEHMKKAISDEEYDLKSVISFKVSWDEMKKPAMIIEKQLPQDCYPIRYSKDTVLTLARADKRGPLNLLAEDVEMALGEAGIPVEVDMSLKKKNETGLEFLDRFIKSSLAVGGGDDRKTADEE